MSRGEVGLNASSLLPSTPAPRSAWIISPAADLLLLIATPLLIVPVILDGAWPRFRVEQISLFVLAFASIGHQLPGFLRAYSDPALFSRYRWRLLLGPPLALLAAWLIAQTQLHALVLLLLLWSTWHVLMQTYGMLRIYESKRGPGFPRSAVVQPRRGRLDFWACVAVFAWGFVGSEARLLILAETAWQIGLPMLTAEGASLLRWTTAISALGVGGCYLWSLAQDYRAGQLAWAKPILLLSTGGLYWLCGMPSIPILLGIAMFEIFHAIQYDALIWSYDRQLGLKVGRWLGPLRRFCERRGSFALLYLGAIGAFGGLRLLAEVIDEPRLQTLLLAAITASTMMHFYFDGFIWQISAAQRQASNESNAESKGWQVPHALKCAGLGIAVGGLLLLESRSVPRAAEEANWLAEAAVWAPHLGDVQQRLCRAQVAAGDFTAALDSAKRATELLPASAEAHADFGAVLLRVGRYDAAAAALSKAHQLDPGSWQFLFDLGLAQTALADWPAAEQAFLAADQAAPGNEQIQRGWAELELARGDALAAAERLGKLIEAQQANPTLASKIDPLLARQWIVALSAAGQHTQAIDAARSGTRTASESPAAWLALGQALNAAKRFNEAVAPLHTALQGKEPNAEARYQLGLAELQLGQLSDSSRQFQLALEADPRHAGAWFQQANIAYAGGDLLNAAHDYRESIRLKPRWAEGHSNLGAVLFAQGNWPAAADEYRRALELLPNHAGAHYNLGLLLLMQNDLAGARREILRAAELGQPCSPEVAEKLGLKL